MVEDRTGTLRSGQLLQPAWLEPASFPIIMFRELAEGPALDMGRRLPQLLAALARLFTQKIGFVHDQAPFPEPQKLSLDQSSFPR